MIQSQIEDNSKIFGEKINSHEINVLQKIKNKIKVTNHKKERGKNQTNLKLKERKNQIKFF